jgi:hypothetical protein
MLIQNLLDFLSGLISQVIASIPPMPYEAALAVSQVVESSAWLGQRVGILGVVFPFSTLTGLVAIWLSILGFWAAVSAVRVVAWAFGR